ncbi:hypothetical protein ID866_3988 [Astraeus odoratus]|nr:hypothetical protein ID866_3988 [Astraeus odoratus]
MQLILYVVLFSCLQSVSCQQIWDIWQTTWDRQKLFTYFQPSPAPINFVTPGPTASADIVINDTSVYQTIYGFGASLTDSSAQLLFNLKNQNSGSYWSLMDYLFDATDGANAAGFSYIRVPLGASDFSAKSTRISLLYDILLNPFPVRTLAYSYDDVYGDAALYQFDIGVTPSYVFTILRDILSINTQVKVHVLPWSPPGWMKQGTMNGGSLNPSYISVMANYLLKSLQGFQSQGIPVYAISIQNEPENSNPTYPTCNMPVSTEGQIGIALRTLMDGNGFTSTKIIGYEHNWVDAANYPVQLMQQMGSAFSGVSFHCYEGSVSDQAAFTSKYPNKEVYFTECSGTIGSDWWSDIKLHREHNVWLIFGFDVEPCARWEWKSEAAGD